MPGENFIDGSGDTPVSWWMFEDSSSPSLDGNNTNNNDLTWGATTSQDSIITYQGISSVIADNNGAGGLTRALASLSANFPLANGVATQGFTIGGAVYFPGYISGTGGAIFQRLDAVVLGGYSFQTFSFIPGSGQLNRFDASCSAGEIISDNTFDLNKWYQIILRYNGDNRSGAGANDELSFWVNGVKQTTTFTPALITLAGGPLDFNWLDPVKIKYDEWFAFDLALLDTQMADIWRYGLSGEDNHSPFVATPNYSLFPKPPIAEAVLRGEM